MTQHCYERQDSCFMPKWVQMGYYWVIGFNPLGFGSETPTQNGFCRSLYGTPILSLVYILYYRQDITINRGYILPIILYISRDRSIYHPSRGSIVATFRNLLRQKIGYTGIASSRSILQELPTFLIILYSLLARQENFLLGRSYNQFFIIINIKLPTRP